MDFYDKIDYTFQDLDDFIKLEVEENRHLDYKDGEALSPNKISEITKDVSSFANSDGGIIIYGVGEDKKTHTPNNYAPITNPKITKEWLEQKINIIQPRIKEVLIFPIRLNKEATGSIYIVKIPKSDDAPHMADDKRYYRRGNFSSEPMYSDEVRDCFFRFSSPLLVTKGVEFHLAEIPQSTEKGLYFRAFVQNERKAVATLYKLNVYLYSKYNLEEMILSRTEATPKECTFTKMDYQSVRIGLSSKEPIFKNECITMGIFYLNNPKWSEDTLKEFYRTLLMRLVLFFEGGVSESLYIPQNNTFIREKDTISSTIKKHFPNYVEAWL